MINYTEKFIADITDKYKYKKLPKNVSKEAKIIYMTNIPSFLNIKGNIITLTDKNNIPICNGYDRIVIGDYGAYVEFSDKQAYKDNFKIKKGEEYRFLNTYNCKYLWFTTTEDSNCKIYYQLNTVVYADYKPNYYYVSVFDVKKEYFKK